MKCLSLREENFKNVHAWIWLVRHKLLCLHWVNLSGCGQCDRRLEDRSEIIDLRAYHFVKKFISQPRHLFFKANMCVDIPLGQWLTRLLHVWPTFPVSQDSSAWSFGNISRRGIDTATFWYCHNDARYISSSGIRHCCGCLLYTSPSPRD